MVPETMTTEEVCIALNISRKTLHNWEKQGKIGFTRIGERKKLYLVEEVNNLIFSNYKK